MGTSYRTDLLRPFVLIASYFLIGVNYTISLTGLNIAQTDPPTYVIHEVRPQGSCCLCPSQAALAAVNISLLAIIVGRTLPSPSIQLCVPRAMFGIGCDSSVYTGLFLGQ